MVPILTYIKDIHTPCRLMKDTRNSYQTIMVRHDMVLHSCQWAKLFPTMMAGKHFLKGKTQCSMLGCSTEEESVTNYTWQARLLAGVTSFLPSHQLPKILLFLHFTNEETKVHKEKNYMPPLVLQPTKHLNTGLLHAMLVFSVPHAAPIRCNQQILHSNTGQKFE